MILFRGSISRVCESLGWKAVFPKPKLCTDNGIMIGREGALKQKSFKPKPQI